VLLWQFRRVCQEGLLLTHLHKKQQHRSEFRSGAPLSAQRLHTSPDSSDGPLMIEMPEESPTGRNFPTRSPDPTCTTTVGQYDRKKDLSEKERPWCGTHVHLQPPRPLAEAHQGAGYFVACMVHLVHQGGGCLTQNVRLSVRIVRCIDSPLETTESQESAGKLEP
jgi:hypothetical protein